MSIVENDYPNDEVENSDVVEALERKLANLESYVRHGLQSRLPRFSSN